MGSGVVYFGKKKVLCRLMVLVVAQEFEDTLCHLIAHLKVKFMDFIHVYVATIKE